MVAKGEIDIAKVRQKIKDTFKTDKEVDQIAEYYATAYAMSTSTAEDVEAIWEEVICDSLADMNVFSGSKMWAEAAEHMGMTIPAVQKAVSEGKANQTRGSPEAEGKASKEIIDLNKDNELALTINGETGANKYKKIAKYILDVLGNEKIILSDGKEAVVDKRDALHIANNAASKKTAQISKIKEIVQAAKLYAKAEGITHPKFNSFYYYKANVRYDGDTFPIFVNVGRASNDKSYHIYDITNKIRDTADRINGLERPKPNEGYALTNGISTNSIPPKTDLSIVSTKKVSDSKASRELDTAYLDAVKSGDMETAQKMVDEAAKKAG